MVNRQQYKKIPEAMTDKEGRPVFRDSFYNPPSKEELLVAQMIGEEVNTVTREGSTVTSLTGYKHNGVFYLTKLITLNY